MFIWATIYGIGAVFVFDTLWRRQENAQAGQSWCIVSIETGNIASETRRMTR